METTGSSVSGPKATWAGLIAPTTSKSQSGCVIGAKAPNPAMAAASATLRLSEIMKLKLPAVAIITALGRLKLGLMEKEKGSVAATAAAADSDKATEPLNTNGSTTPLATTPSKTTLVPGIKVSIAAVADTAPKTIDIEDPNDALVAVEEILTRLILESTEKLRSLCRVRGAITPRR